MELIKNLIEHKLIQPGTWLGVKTALDYRVHHRLRVERVSTEQVWACVPNSGQVVPISAEHICEVDGMSMHRVCAQADLDAQGFKLKPQTRRGRKPKHARTK
jgi:hypothetical protein